MGAADADRHFVLHGAGLEGGEHLVEIGQKDIGGAHELHVEAGVEHVRGGHALMHEAGLFAADMFGEVGEEGDHVMLGHGLDLVDAGDVELHVLGLPDGLGIFLGDHAEIGHGVAGMGLDLVPDLELGFRRPDGDHFGAGIARDHVWGFPYCERGPVARGLDRRGAVGKVRGPGCGERPLEKRSVGGR